MAVLQNYEPQLDNSQPDEPTEAETQELALISEDQIKLDIKESKFDWFYSIRRKVTEVEAVAEAIPYWRNFSAVAALMSSIAFIGIITYLILSFYDILPPEIPLIYSQAGKSWDLIEKEFLPVIPVFLGVLLILTIRFNISSYSFDRRLAYIVNLAVTIFNIFGLIAFLQIFSLILIY